MIDERELRLLSPDALMYCRNSTGHSSTLARATGSILYELAADIKRFWRRKEKCVAFLQHLLEVDNDSLNHIEPASATFLAACGHSTRFAG